MIPADSPAVVPLNGDKLFKVGLQLYKPVHRVLFMLHIVIIQFTF